MAASPPPGPPKPRPDHPARPQPEAPKPMDLKKLPSGHVPEAWKNLPPPTIVRAEPEKPKDTGTRFREALKTRAAKQVAIGAFALILIAGAIFAFRPKYTLASPIGATTLFARALEARDVAAMREASTEGGAMLCDGVLAQVVEMETSGRASRFANARPVVEGRPAGDTAPGYIVCEGENGDDFMRVNLILARQGDEWRISEMGAEPLEN